MKTTFSSHQTNLTIFIKIIECEFFGKSLISGMYVTTPLCQSWLLYMVPIFSFNQAVIINMKLFPYTESTVWVFMRVFSKFPSVDVGSVYPMYSSLLLLISSIIKNHITIRTINRVNCGINLNKYHKINNAWM